MQIDLRGKVSLVTGASRGIGRGIAIALARAGSDVIVHFFRNRDAAEKTAEEIRSWGRQAVTVRGHLAEESHIDRMFKEAIDRFGRLDVLVSNAASGVNRPLLEVEKRHWEWTLGINAWALVALVQRAVTLMPRTGGRIVAVSSLGARRALPCTALWAHRRGRWRLWCAS